MKKILFVVGPTATGKTGLGLKLSQKFTGEIISADSRQVYKGMDIGTGKDLPVNIKYQISNIKISDQKIKYYLINGTRLWGYDLVDPTEEFSVSHFYKIAWAIIEDIWKRNKTPIIVGGTGFYIDSILSPPSNMGIAPNEGLRNKLNSLSLTKLQEILRDKNAERFNKMNNSDRNNPRRLVRAIEATELDTGRAKVRKSDKEIDDLWIGLRTDSEKVNYRIKKRIKDRVDMGFEKEFNNLLNNNLLAEGLPASSAMGYKQWNMYTDGKLDKQQAILAWEKAEIQYVRRQMTWFKRNHKIKWFDVNEDNWRDLVVEKVKSWYS
jgi:tRNA dimethylallyltransferase